MDRKKVIDFLESEETYNKVLDIISMECRENGTQIDEHPQEYFIAGGAISNTIHHILNPEINKKPVINDIDFFFFNRRTELDFGLYNDGGFITQTLNPVVSMDDYGRTWLGSRGESIRMSNSERFGIVNKVTIDVHLSQSYDAGSAWLITTDANYDPSTIAIEFVSTDYYKQLIQNFDLNCCCVGIDRVNNKIIYTKKFVDFLCNNKIEVMSVTYPLQTAVRMLRKSKELQSDVTNFETEMSLLQHSFVLNREKTIGQEWFEKSKKCKSFVMKYFLFSGNESHMRPVLDGLYTYTSKEFSLVQYFDQFHFKSENSLIGFWDLFVRKKDLKKLNELITFYVQNTSFKVGPSEEVYWAHSKTYRGKIKTANINFDFIDSLGLVPDYFDSDFNAQDLKVIYEANKILQEEFVDPKICLTSNIKSHLKFLSFFLSKFVDIHGNLKKELLWKCIGPVSHINRMGISSFDCDEKIKAFKKALNNTWFNLSDSFKFKHNFRRKNKFIDLNDLEF